MKGCRSSPRLCHGQNPRLPSTERWGGFSRVAGKRARAERGAANTRRRRKGPPLAQRGACPSAGNRTAPTWKPLPAWAPRSSHQRSTLRVMLQTGSHTRPVAEGPTATSESVLKTRGTSGVLVVTKCRGPFSSSSPLLPPSLSLLNARLPWFPLPHPGPFTSFAASLPPDL